MKYYTMMNSANPRWAGYTIVWWYKNVIGDPIKNTDTFFWDVAAGQREVDRLNQAELSMAQGKETV